VNTSSLISFLALLFYSILLGVILAQKRGGSIQRYFTFFLAAMLVWSLGSLVIFINMVEVSTLWLNRLMMVGSLAVPITFYAFVQKHLGRAKYIPLWVGFLVYLLLQVANLLGWLILSAQVEGNQLHNEYGLAAVIAVSVVWILFFGMAAFDLMRDYRRSTMEFQRTQIGYLLAVALIIFVGSLTKITLLKVYPLDLACNTAAAVVLFDAIFRRQLLEISDSIKKRVLYSFPTILIGVAYFLLIYLVIHLVKAQTGLTAFILALLVAVLVALVVQPVRERIQAWIDRLFYREKADTSLMLHRLNQNMTSLLAIDELTSMIISEMTRTMHISRAGFFLKQGESGQFSLVSQAGMGSSNFKLSSQSPLVEYLNSESQVLTRSDLDIYPQFRALWLEELEEIDKIGAELFIALKAKDKLVGILVVGSKLSGQSYSLEERLTLTTLANQMATSIENAMLFASEVKQRYKAETLQNVLIQLTSDLDLEKVLDNILVKLETVIPYDSACIFLLQNDQLTAVAGRGFKDPHKIIGQDYLIADDELFLDIQRTRRPVVIPDVSSDRRFKYYGGENNIRSWMGVPLIARGVVIGCVTLDSDTPATYREAEQASLAQAFASHASIAVENARLFTVEHEQRQTAEAFREIGSVLNTTLDFDHVLDLLLDQLDRVVPYSIANMIIFDEGTMHVVRTRYHNKISPDAVQLLRVSPFTISSAPNLYFMVDTTQPLVISTLPQKVDWIESPVPIRSWLGAPIVAKGKTIACFSLYELEAGVYRQRHTELLAAYAAQAALALQNARLFSEIEQLATHDDLTGIFNRRYFIELGEREFNRSKRYNRELSVVMLDIDNFKRVNDQYGHSIGDQVLHIIAERCKSNIREVDILGRYGGEEFIVFLPEASAGEALTIAERLRKNIARMPITTTAGQINLTVSLGTASITAETLNLVKLIDNADYAMYMAKKKGRNLACAYDDVNT
jgi:diguanylate cyclase (GGDEF)-like protein